MGINKIINIKSMPMVALRGLVMFPGMIMNFDVGRKISLNALQAAAESDRYVYLVTQKDITEEEIAEDSVYPVGCVAKIVQVLRGPDKTARVVVEGKYKATHNFITQGENYFSAIVEQVEDITPKTRQTYVEALKRRIRDGFEMFATLEPKISAELMKEVFSLSDVGYLTNLVAFNLPCSYEEKQQLLELCDPVSRAKLLVGLIKKETELAKIDIEIGEKVKQQIDEGQREYYLREQIKVINEELYGDNLGGEDEFQEYAGKIESLNAPASVKEKLKNELNKLIKMPQGAHEAVVVRSYLDTCIKLPWDACTKTEVNIKKSAKILDRDFHSMEKVKERILEMLSVYSLAPDIKSQIICLVGPPGVGKTSIGKTIAECTGRQYARVSLGGVRDESEIRGHRRTYVAAMPGKIINAIIAAGSSNPLILLDEIDKLGSDYKGDPASAMLEVLDPEQNSAFNDHFLDMPYDLSRVLFITTANSVDTIPAPLLDRMEIIELSSYTREEKFNIAKKHIVPKEAARHGLSSKTVKITDKALYGIIDFYTREAGVRKLERTVAALCRKAAKQIAEKKTDKVTVDEKLLIKMLGAKKYTAEQILKKDEVGVINGLAWTSVGGEIMQMEVAVCAGTGKIELTGSLGDVMKESARAAITFVRLNAEKYNIASDFYKTKDIHIHATEAAVPKDGPSAGVTIATALISALTGVAVKRDIAMTGEITIRGRVMPIGGLKEKSMAAYRAGVTTVFIPSENEADLAEIDAVVKEKIKFIAVDNVNTIIEGALAR